jgi:hypothetical protein
MTVWSTASIAFATFLLSSFDSLFLPQKLLVEFAGLHRETNCGPANLNGTRKGRTQLEILYQGQSTEFRVVVFNEVPVLIAPEHRVES